MIHQLQAHAEATLLPAMRAISGQSAIRFTELASYPGLDTAVESEAADWIAQFCGSRDFGTVAFGTEGGLFAGAAFPPWSAAPAAWPRGTSPTNSSPRRNWTAAMPCWVGCWPSLVASPIIPFCGMLN